VYCDSRSACYEIEDFDGEVLVKANAIDLLRDELPRKRKKGIIGTGSMNDPYMPLEETMNLTGRALEVIAEHGFGVHVITKSDLVLRDIPLLKKIARVSAVVSLTVTTTDDELSRKLEPGAPTSSARLRALKRLAEEGIETRIALTPVLPFIEDTVENVEAIVEEARRCGVKAIIAAFGMTMRDRQRDHFYRCLDAAFSGMRKRYEAQYGESYQCSSPNADTLHARFTRLCSEHGIATSVQPYLAPSAQQLRLFG